MIYTIDKRGDRRELDADVRAIYDKVSEAGDQMSRSTYAALIQGGANALYRFGKTIVPKIRAEFSNEPHVIQVI